MTQYFLINALASIFKKNKQQQQNKPLVVEILGLHELLFMRPDFHAKHLRQYKVKFFLNNDNEESSQKFSIPVHLVGIDLLACCVWEENKTRKNIKRKGGQMNTFAAISSDACSELLSIHD